MTDRVDIKTIAEALGVSTQATQKRANKELWSFDEVPFAGRNKRLYQLEFMPKVVREAVLSKRLHQIMAAPAAQPCPAPRKTEVFRPDGAMVKRGLVRRVKDESNLNDIDRARRDAGLVLCQAIESAMALSQCSAKHAMTELAERVLGGIARPELVDAATITYIKPRKTGQTVDSMVSRFQKMYAAYQQGRSEGDIGRYLVPGKAEKTGYDPIHVHAFLMFYCRPARPPRLQRNCFFSQGKSPELNCGLGNSQFNAGMTSHLLGSGAA